MKFTIYVETDIKSDITLADMVRRAVEAWCEENKPDAQFSYIRMHVNGGQTNITISKG